MEGVYSSSKVFKKSANYRAVRSAISDRKSEIGICSSSETRDQELMWAHYAHQFSGICIEYSLSSLLSLLPKDASFVRMFYDERGPYRLSIEQDSHRACQDGSLLQELSLAL